MSTVCYTGPNDLIDRVEKDGYFVIKNFFKREAVEKARAELEIILDKDEKRRIAMGGRAIDDSVEFRSIYTKLMHTIWFPALQSPAYKQLADDMFESDVIKDFMQALTGDSFRLRIDLIRRSSGDNDHVDKFQLPHDWHRDARGEFTFGIFFDDLPEHGGGGGTAVIPETHWDKNDPRWDLMLGNSKNFSRKEHYANRELRHIPDDYIAEATHNQQVAEEANKSKVEITGQRGDLYLFLNDTWHGRAPNISGNRYMISRIGGFATDTPFKDDIPLPPSMAGADGALAEGFSADKAPNTQKNTLMRRVWQRRDNEATTKAAQEKSDILERFYADAAKTAQKTA